MTYHQITPAERYRLATLRKQVPALSCAAMAGLMGRHRSTISREFRRNSARHDGAYRHSKAQERTNGRRSRSRRNSQFSAAHWTMIENSLGEYLSPEQISGRLRRDGILNVSHETIYKHIWRDKRYGGQLYRSLRQPTKTPKAVRQLREAWACGRQAAHLRTARRGGATPGDWSLGNGYCGRDRKQGLHRHSGRACDEVYADRKARGSDVGRAQPANDSVDPASSGMVQDDSRRQWH